MHSVGAAVQSAMGDTVTAKSSQILTPQSCKEQGARIKKGGLMKERGWYAPHNISLASCPSGRRSGWAVRRFDSLVLSEVPVCAGA